MQRKSLYLGREQQLRKLEKKIEEKAIEAINQKVNDCKGS